MGTRGQEFEWSDTLLKFGCQGHMIWQRLCGPLPVISPHPATSAMQQVFSTRPGGRCIVSAVGADPVDLQFEGALLFVGQLQAEAVGLGWGKGLVWQFRAAPAASQFKTKCSDLLMSSSASVCLTEFQGTELSAVIRVGDSGMVERVRPDQIHSDPGATATLRFAPTDPIRSR